MYLIKADDLIIYDDTIPFNDKEIDVIDAKLTLQESAAGQLDLTLPPSNCGYNTIQRLTTTIKVYKYEKLIWTGRVLSESIDFFGNRSLTVEGALAFLNDTVQPQDEFHNMTVLAFLNHLIEVHNKRSERKFKMGSCTVEDANDSIYRFTNYETTIEAINEKLLKRLNGLIRVRYVDNDPTPVIDYLKDQPRVNSQVIQFGENLLDFTKNWDMSDFCTVVLPLGAEEEQDEDFDYEYDENGNPIYDSENNTTPGSNNYHNESLRKHITVAPVNNNSIFVPNNTMVAKYGWIERVIEFNDVHVPENLLKYAQDYLKDIQFDAMELELQAVDLNYYNLDAESIEISDSIRVVSEPHGLDRRFPVKKLSIPLMKPENTTFTLGDSNTTSLTSINTDINEDVYNRIDGLPSKYSVLELARKNATALLNMAGNDGFLVLRKNEVLVMDEPKIENARNIWRWNMNGFAHSSNGYRGPFDTAITMDGWIMGEHIAANSIHAQQIDVNYTTTQEKKWQDELSDNYWTNTTVQSKIQNAADNILLSVEESAGGNDNLLKNTRNPQDSTDLHSAFSGIEYNDGYKENCFCIGAAGTTNATLYSSEMLLKPGLTYTFSTDISKNFNEAGTLIVNLGYFETKADADGNKNAKRLVGKNITLATGQDRKRYDCSFATPVKIYKGWLQIGLDTSVTSRKVYLNRLKFEEGGKNTYYTPNTCELVTRSSLKLTSDSLKAEVSKKIGPNEIISAINISPETIAIKSGKIKLEGIVTANKNFRISEAGSCIIKSLVVHTGMEIYPNNNSGGNVSYIDFHSTSSSGDFSNRLASKNGNFVLYNKGYAGGVVDLGVLKYNSLQRKSDRRLKTDIKELDLEKSLYLVQNLIPYQFKMTTKGDDQLHHGFIYQEAVELVDDKDWAFLQEFEDEDLGKTTFGALDYEEVIPDLLNVCKFQQKQIKDLQERVEKLEALERR